MNIFIAVLYLLGLLPILHLILIGLIHKRSNGKISTKAIYFYVLLTLEIVIVLVSIIFPMPDGGIFLYYILIGFIGMVSLILQCHCYKNVDTIDEKTSLTTLTKIWGIAIAVGLICWIFYYVIKLLPLIIP